MIFNRRTFVKTSAAAAGAVTVLPYAGRVLAQGADVFETPAGPVTVHPISHASFVMETPAGTIYVDPDGDAALYDGLPGADLVLVTHEHGDHFAPETLAALMGDETHLIVNPAVAGMLSAELAGRAESLANGGQTTWEDVSVRAIPAYNITEERLNFHPEGRDNGYVLGLDGFTVYVSGDTEDIPEMRALQDIDLAFVCMNLPFTMNAEAAASAVREFGPTHVYPYHYRGRDGGTQDPEEFADLVGDAADTRLGGWYGA